MVFAEQRLIAMCASQMGKKIHTFSNLTELFGNKQRSYTHLWGYKETLRKDSAAAERFCQDCAMRLKHDFPAWAEKLAGYGWAEQYL